MPDDTSARATTPPASPQMGGGGARHHTRGGHRFLGLLVVLSKKNFQVRYKRAVLGVGWAMLQPLVYAGVLAFVLTRIVDFRPVPDYFAFMLCGVMPWSFFSQGLNVATTSVVDNASLVKKVAVPNVLFPAAAVGGSWIAYSGPLVILVGTAVATGNAGLNLLWLPPAVALHAALVVAAGVITSSYFVAFRDIRYLVESGLLIAFYATPVIYTLDHVSDTLQSILRLNPMTGVLSLYRAAIVDRAVDATAVTACLAIVALLAVAALTVFRSRSTEFADLL